MENIKCKEKKEFPLVIIRGLCVGKVLKETPEEQLVLTQRLHKCCRAISDCLGAVTQPTVTSERVQKWLSQ